MKKYIPFILTILIFTNINAQIELIQNGSFEDYSFCPTTFGQVYLASPWHNYGGYQFGTATPDYFHACVPDILPMDVPDNHFGFQYASDGSAYCGMYCYYANGANEQFREIIGSQLLYPLIPSHSYHLSFKIAKASIPGYDLAVNHIGMKFSMISHDSVNNQAPIDNIAQLYIDTVMTDTTNWVMLEADWIADSAYQYVMIGNFFDDAHTDTVQPEPGSPYAYYYVDEISVLQSIEDGETEINLARAFNVVINGDEAQINFNITTENVILLNMLGQTIGGDVGKHYDGEKEILSLKNYSQGMYIIIVRSNGRFFIQKFLKPN